MIITSQVLAAAFAAIQTAGAGQAAPMTLDQAIAIAEQNAFAVRIQSTAVEKSHQHINEMRAGLGPKLGATGTYTRYPSAITANFGSSGSITIQPISTTTVALSMSLPIDILGDLRRQVSVAVAQYQSQQATMAASQSDTRLNVRTDYFNVLRAIAQVEVAREGLADAQDRLTQAQQEYEAKQLAKVDVESFETQLAQSESNLINAKNSVELANEQFNQLLARPIDSPVNLVDPEALPPTPTEIDALVRGAQARRPEVLAMRKNVKALEDTVKVNEVGLHPSLNAALSQQQLVGTGGFGASTVTTVGTLTLTVPFFDSGLTRARVREARQDVESARISLEQEELGISTEVRTAVANIASARARLQSAQTQVSVAEEVFRLAKVRQSAGVATYVEVIDAENSLTQARSNLVTAKYDYLTGFAQLQRAVGSDDLGGLAPAPASNSGGQSTQ